MGRISFSEFAPKRTAEEMPQFVSAKDLAESGDIFEIFAIRKVAAKTIKLKNGKRKAIGAQIAFDIVVEHGDTAEVRTLTLAENDYRSALFDHFKEQPRGTRIGPVRLEMTDDTYYSFVEVDPVDSEGEEEDTARDDTNTPKAKAQAAKAGRGRPSIKGR